MASKIELCPYGRNNSQSHIPQCLCNRSKNIPKTFSISSSESESCYRVQKWMKLVRLPKTPDKIYPKVLSLANNQPEDPQLLLDISRTFPKVDYFGNGLGKNVLSRMLHGFIAYNPNLGYVQGMNYIAATLLWHSTEVDAFWLFVVLFEDFELRDNFIPGFPGLTKHYHIIDFLINHHLPELYTHFLNLSISVQMFCTEWIMTLFTSIIPLEFSFRVLGNFFKFGWVFFYKLCLEFIKRLEKKLLLCFNYAGVLSTLKPDGHSVKDWKMFMKTMVKGRENINFKKIVNEAQSLEINERFLNCMLHNASNVLLV